MNKILMSETLEVALDCMESIEEIAGNVFPDNKRVLSFSLAQLMMVQSEDGGLTDMEKMLLSTVDLLEAGEIHQANQEFPFVVPWIDPDVDPKSFGYDIDPAEFKSRVREMIEEFKLVGN